MMAPQKLGNLMMRRARRHAGLRITPLGQNLRQAPVPCGIMTQTFRLSPRRVSVLRLIGQLLIHRRDHYLKRRSDLPDIMQPRPRHNHRRHTSTGTPSRCAMR